MNNNKISFFIQNFLKRIFFFTGIDNAIVFTIGLRFWQIIATPITLFLIVKYFSIEEQGFYYTFLSLAGLQVFVELGIGGVLMQFVSYEWAGLAFTKDGYVDGNSLNKERFISLLRFGTKWYLIGGVFLFFFALVIGTTFLGSKPHQTAWQLPWLLLVISSSLLLIISSFFPVLEGCHKVDEVAKIRVLGSIISNIIVWFALILGVGLFAPGLMLLITFLTYFIYLISKYKSILYMAFLKIYRPSNKFAWKVEFLPMQWRTALTWGSGYFIWQFIIPILFYYNGAKEAGQMGISMSIALGLYTVSLSWMTTKAPKLGTLKADNSISEMKKLFLITVKQSLIIYFTLASIAWISLFVGSFFYPLFTQRFLTPLLFGLLFISFAATLLIGHLAIFLRAFKEEPLVWVNFVSALLIGLSVYQFAQRWGAVAMILSLLLVGFCISLPWSLFIWHRKWKLMELISITQSK